MADTEDLSGGIQPMFDDPNLPKGWSREVVQRKVGGRYEVSLMTPDGKQLKTRAELGQYIKDNKIKMRPDEFDFTVMGKNYVPSRSGRTRTAAKPPKPEAKSSKKDTVKKDEKTKAKKPSKTPAKEKVAATPTRRSARGGAKDTEDDEEQEEETVKKKTQSTKKKKEDSGKEEEPSEDDSKEDMKEKILPKRGRVKPKRYDSPEPEPAPRRAKMKALFKDIDDEAEEPETPSRGRGRPKKVDIKEEPEEKSPTKGKKTGAKKAKPKKRTVDADDPDAAKNSQILAEIEAELAEINGTTGRRRGARKRRGSSSTTVKTQQETKPILDNNNKDRPALEGFEVEDEADTKRQRSESKSSDVLNEVKTESKPEEAGQSQIGSSAFQEIPPDLADGRRRSARAKKIDIPALLRPDPDSPDEEEEIFAKPKKQKKLTSPKPVVKSEKKKAKSARRRRTSKAVSEDEDESIPLESLQGAINSASSLLDDHSDDSGEQDAPQDAAPKAAAPKVSRSGRNVRSPRRPMENDFETDFSTLRRAMNATTSDFASRKRAKHLAAMGMQAMHYAAERQYHEQNYDQLQYDYFAQANAFKRANETARTRTFEENKMEKTMSLMDPGLVLGAQDREPLLLETHLRAAEPPAASFQPKRQRKSSSQSDVRTGDKVVYRKLKPGSSSKQHMDGDRSLLKNFTLETSGEGDHMESLLSQQPTSSKVLIGRDPKDMISEMTPPPTHPIVPSDDHTYSLSSRYLGESASLNTTESGDSDTNAPSGSSGVETRVMSIDQHDLLNQISAHSVSHVGPNVISSTSLSALGEGVTVPISSVGGVNGEAGSAPKEIVIYVGDKPTVVPVMQDESGMSVITLPNGIAEEDIQASLQAGLQAAS